MVVAEKTGLMGAAELAGTSGLIYINSRGLQQN